ncbi:hypothetical protein SPRG_04593 [Saprolegnia parasitica CBS 223.65]|uniref:Folate receptor-like domain-containing protein n=1 Tax=Saprolegnia parasitica (strain CBS 223.65) TaxID=695850 RepID=A0A067CW20_SAPPC|nr:hypothetical protein SPRG_04593 [Saprolegnia parasitica CBS 223.65]KDO30691.1 hypothetical protein SPRG_04593 [Saprolegnia parasitica CBS 223.65]|eukprot:XP_012198395.1 hypothetical protein SPRG_04593 [Saprolegnia parasitica CBS 223.65]
MNVARLLGLVHLVLASADAAATCLASGTSAALTSARYPLSFCPFTQARCCLPAHDQAILAQFLQLISAGASCAETLNPAKTSLARVMCAACNPFSPQFLSPPVSASFFTTAKTFKVCSRLATLAAPANFDSCGLNQLVYRGSVCSPNNPATSQTWSACSTGAYVCQSAMTQTFYCQPTPCIAMDVPTGFANAPCDAAENTCSSAFLFLNDNGAAKPVFYEKYPVEIVDAANGSCLDADDSLLLLATAASPSAHRDALTSLVWIVVLYFVAF